MPAFILRKVGALKLTLFLPMLWFGLLKRRRVGLSLAYLTWCSYGHLLNELIPSNAKVAERAFRRLTGL